MVEYLNQTMKFLNACNKIIEFSFYTLFFLVPLIFWKDTSELYELNKMWLVFILAILIAAAWVVKIVVLKKFYLQRTPLDIPILVFLISQIISTIFSWDPYVSLWGYYSRFNGGLLSILSYIFLYYAFISNFSLARGGEKEGLPTARTSVLRERALAGGNIETGPRAIDMVKKLLMISLISAALVALWGFPSHFGYDPTCLIFRGSFDVSCWTADFQPKIRIFSTLGQPAWLGAYLAILAPLIFALFLNEKRRLHTIGYVLLVVLFYLDILFTRSRGAVIGFWISIAVFAALYFWSELKGKLKLLNRKFIIYHLSFIILIIMLLVTTILVNFPFNSKSTQKTQNTGSFSTGGGGTESGRIRLFVWKGALNAWLHHPIVGTGVETFAFAYYKYKPVGHNLTSEWNYLYNKAHNEYLNFLATTGILGLGSYLFIIGTFLFIIYKYLKSNIYHRKSSIINDRLYIPALSAGYISILITNFFGFSVVIVNLYFFLIPTFVFVLLNKLNPKNAFVYHFGKKTNQAELSLLQKGDIFVTLALAIYLILFFVNFWLADQAFALGGNLARAGEYKSSYSQLKDAVQRVPFEPVYKDELAGSDALLAAGLISSLTKDDKEKEKTLTLASDLAKETIILTTQITKDHPNNIVFLKTQVRVYYILSQIDPKYSRDALSAIQKAQKLAPTDANIYYNLALLYGQNNETDKAVEALKSAIAVKPNYENAYYALGLFYRQMATDKTGKVIDLELNKKAIEQMEYILKYLNPKNNDAKEALEAFSKGI